jgi:hypothetical protein
MPRNIADGGLRIGEDIPNVVRNRRFGVGGAGIGNVKQTRLS